jgi:hypothetical protein
MGGEMSNDGSRDVPEPDEGGEQSSVLTFEDTAVTKWLKGQRAGSFAEAFHSAGYLTVADVDADAVDELVGKKERGTALRLKNDLANRTREAKPMVPPALPAGTPLDLSRPEVKIGGDVTFSIPFALSVESSQAAIRSPYALADGDWVVLARNAALLYGFRMDGPAPIRARRPVLEWVVPDGFDFVRSEIFQARVESILAYSEETATYVSSGFDKISATVGLPFCAASFERSQKERTAHSSTRKELHVVGRWKYPRATLFLEGCTRVSEKFERAVRNALEHQDPAAEMQKVLDDYGHAVPREVTLGGLLYFRHVRTEVANVEEKKVEQEYRAAVEAKYAGYSASGGYAKGTGKEETTASQQIAEQTSFDVLGGDATLVSTPSAWAPTVKDPQLWAAIDIVGLVSPIELLSRELRDEVKRLVPLAAYSGLPAIEEPLEVETNRGTRAVTAGFLLGLQDCVKDGARGSVFLASGRQDKEEDDRHAFAGGASAHKYSKTNVSSDVNGMCLPVPANADYGVWTGATSGVPEPRTAFARTRFGFGTWAPFDQQQREADGFLAVTVRAPQGGRAEVLVEVDGRQMAGASAHYNTQQDAHLERATLCIPVPAGSTVKVVHVTGTPVREAWIPLAPGLEQGPDGKPRSVRWRMRPPVTVEANTRLTAETDGILHGFVRADIPTHRATNWPAFSLSSTGHVRLHLYTERAPALWAGGSAHHSINPMGGAGARFGRYATAILPVGRGTHFMASFNKVWGSPVCTLWWTPITEAESGS